MTKQSFAIPLSDEDHNYCPWIIGEVEHDDPDADLAPVIRAVQIVPHPQGADYADRQATVRALIVALQIARFTVRHISVGQLYWMDF